VLQQKKEAAGRERRKEPARWGVAPHPTPRSLQPRPTHASSFQDGPARHAAPKGLEA
jgi:hypothetical protein